MIQRVLIIYIAGILLYHFLLGLGPWQEGQWERQDASVASGYAYSDSIRAGCERLLTRARLQDETVALAQGMLLGDKHLLQKAQKQEMREAGMSHLLAVSGLHIGIIWALISLLLRPLVLLSDRGWHRWIIMLLLWGYIAVIGFPASAVRAGVMITMVQVSWFLERDVWGWHNLCSAALIILLFQPMQIYEIGFQFSFLATAGILVAAPWLREEGRCRQFLIITLSAQFFTLPLVAYYFHDVPVFGWIQGFLVVPIVALFVYLLLVLLVMSALGIPWMPLVECADALSQWVGFVARQTLRLEVSCLGGRLSFYPNLLETLLSLASLVIIAYLLVRVLRGNSRW